MSIMTSRHGKATLGDSVLTGYINDFTICVDGETRIRERVLSENWVVTFDPEPLPEGVE